MAKSGGEAKIDKFDFLIIGGGIAGTTCAQKLSILATESNPSVRILVLSSSPMVKIVTNLKQVGSGLVISFHCLTIETDIMRPFER